MTLQARVFVCDALQGMAQMTAVFFIRGHVRSSATFASLIAVLAATTFLAGCGAPASSSSPAAVPVQPNYPSAPPVAVTWTPQGSPLPAPEAQVPPPPGSNDFPLTIANPTDGVTVTSPVNVKASAKPTNSIFFMRVYVDQLAVYYTSSDSIDAQIFIMPGTHKLEVMAEDSQGYISATILNVTISSQTQSTTISDIQTMPGWQSCSALFPKESQRHGQICAAGLGTAVSTMTEGQSTPSMDGKSAQFAIGGPTGYSNMLYFNPVAGGNNVSHFTYDLYFYIDKPELSEALEFDLNQTFGGTRWVWGSECSFQNSGKWDIWDDINGWKPTSVDCKPFPANTWIHLVWKFERVGNQVHYISLTVGDQTYNIDTYYQAQPNWTLEEIDVAFQMDGNYAQQPYNVWLDKVNLTAE
jgi:hypothetical protein